MKTSKSVLKNAYGVTDNHFFASREDRNTYYANNPDELSPGVVCAVTTAESVDITDESAEIWILERYNNSNWVEQSVDPNYALVITTEGLAAITKARQGEYSVKITAIKIKQNNIVNPKKSLLQWTKEDFEADGDIILDSETNVDFQLERVLGWRRNMANGGIQYTIRIDTDTYGEYAGRRYDTYTIGAVGLYVADPDEPTRNVLFAIGNLNAKINKYTTTATTVGNSIKLLLNTVITNLGYVSDLTLFKESVNSVPEVATEDDLVEEWGPEVQAPYNLYLVNNFSGTNIPALAIRGGDPSREKVTWQYFTPKYDVLNVRSDQIDSQLLDYMFATWDSQTGKFVKAEPGAGVSPTNNLTGIKIGETIVYDGKVSCYDLGITYDINISDEGTGYEIGDLLRYATHEDTRYIEHVWPEDFPDIEFKIRVKSINANGGIKEFTIVSISGDGEVRIEDANFLYDSAPERPSYGSGAKANIESTGSGADKYIWDFPGGETTGDPVDWYNKPLYVDSDWTSIAENPATRQQWVDYCEDIGLDPDKEDPDRRGKLTISDTDYLVGWCIGTGSKSTIKLTLDLQNKATEYDYGITRYATNTEVREKSADAKTVTSLTPSSAFDNYLQRSKPNSGAGSAWNNRLEVDSFVQFNTTVVGKNAVPTQAIMEDQNLSFFGTAYRARWQDLAEYYRSDKVYPAGTLICMGCGAEEITQAITECNGIVSERPGYELGEKKDEKDLPVALVGKVPVMFDGDCNPRFGDRIYLSQKEPGKASNVPYGKCLGKIIDKSEDLREKGTILCSVRISF